MNNVHHDHNSAYWNLNDEENQDAGKKIGKVWGLASLRGEGEDTTCETFHRTAQCSTAAQYFAELLLHCTIERNCTDQ